MRDQRDEVVVSRRWRVEGHGVDALESGPGSVRRDWSLPRHEHLARTGESECTRSPIAAAYVIPRRPAERQKASVVLEADGAHERQRRIDRDVLTHPRVDAVA